MVMLMEKFQVADHATGDVLRPAFHYVKTAPGISVVSEHLYDTFLTKVSEEEMAF